MHTTYHPAFYMSAHKLPCNSYHSNYHENCPFIKVNPRWLLKSLLWSALWLAGTTTRPASHFCLENSMFIHLQHLCLFSGLRISIKCNECILLHFQQEDLFCKSAQFALWSTVLNRFTPFRCIALLIFLSPTKLTVAALCSLMIFSTAIFTGHQ
jgi:hypothetical protein